MAADTTTVATTTAVDTATQQLQVLPLPPLMQMMLRRHPQLMPLQLPRP